MPLCVFQIDRIDRTSRAHNLRLIRLHVQFDDDDEDTSRPGVSRATSMSEHFLLSIFFESTTPVR